MDGFRIRGVHTRMQGLVVKYFKKHGRNSYGMIQSEGQNYYFNRASLTCEVKAGDKVEFKGERNEKGNVACSVKRVNCRDAYVI